MDRLTIANGITETVESSSTAPVITTQQQWVDVQHLEISMPVVTVVMTDLMVFDVVELNTNPIGVRVDGSLPPMEPE